MYKLKKINILAIALSCLLPTVVNAANQPAASQPNIVVIMADDVGIGDISALHRRYTNKPVVVETPAIDSLAAQGMSFTDAHSPTALCAPTRYSVMSGNNTYRAYAKWGVWSTFAKTAVTMEDATIGRIGKEAGYTTGFVGKWHLGGTFLGKDGKVYKGAKGGPKSKNIDLTKWVAGNPKELGFDYDFTAPTGVQGPTYSVHENGQWYKFDKASKIIYVDEHSALDKSFVADKGPGMGDSHWDATKLNMMLADKAAGFIKRSAKADKPFMLNYWSPATHIPHTPPKQIDGEKILGSTPTQHLDMTRVLDLEVARIINALKEAGEYENTLIIFTSDNGGLPEKSEIKAGHNSSATYNGRKNSPLEGGHRVPFIAVWPGKIKPGTSSDSLVNGTDIVATIASVTQVKLNENQAKDSWNLLPALLGESFTGRDFMMQQAGSQNQLMLREGDWKLIIQSNNKVTKREIAALYNLKDDPSEKRNLVKAPEHKTRVQTMFKKYWDIRESGQRTAPVNNKF
ncbi:sulfatase family protein [Paraglaciecola sp.]|uniref:sulfatase family protein n=1 Tax=Paraglaciecola sp. TaxID=1920173 RepID=UPI003EF64946